MRLTRKQWLWVGIAALMFFAGRKSTVVIPDDEPVNMRVLNRYS